ncbi:Na+/H+ antiporter NhaC [Nitrosomonas sp. Is37]|uniref:Na+/H+ antiporter NhaC n=1 Tax=Nitrosomonas sp. Is37 TaxID=3080535 RepID=UPI00294B34C4|nr:Na+/H+ antiporter NhaC [Nitrosomonas sp. Is37]MDV6345597.1 Na+/H+ antiporter NhaC [Nitrosomonas sp. Is37]
MRQINISRQEDLKEPSLFQAIVCLLGVFLMISLGFFVLEISIHAIIFMCLLWVGIHAAILGHTFTDIQRMMSTGIGNALPAIYIFILIGMVIASFMQSGTIASLLYYGLNLLNPAVFLASGLILCSLMSIATGTSWGTVGTIGIVLISIAEVIDIPLAIVAGMIVSGATFGDKLSPISDTTNLAAVSAGTNLYRHIHAMLYTTLPAYVLTLILFIFVGLQYEDYVLPAEEIVAIQTALNSTFQLNLWVTLLPLLCMFGMSIKNYSPAMSMSCSVILAILIAVFYQERNIIEVLSALWLNEPGSTGIDNIDFLLGHGGIYSMAWSLLLSIMALALGGILHHAKFLSVILERLILRIKRVRTLIATTILSGFISNIGMGEAYISIILNCQLFKDAYHKAQLDGAILSRSAEEGATMTTALIPWTTTGAFYTATLGISVLDYAPYAFLNVLNPIVAVVMASLGIGLLQRPRVDA